MMPKLYSVVSSSDSSKPVASFSSLAAVNFSGQAVGGIRSAFTVGGWVRPIQMGTSQTVFQAPGQFRLSIDSEGYLAATILGNAPEVRSLLPISNTNWHHVAASFEQDTADERKGLLTVFLDGFPNSMEMDGTSTAIQAACTLGAAGESNALEFASWTIWTRALPGEPFDLPPWGAPSADSPLREGLLGVFDFAGQQVTSSNQSISVICTTQTTTYPCLVTGKRSYALLDPPVNVAVGNPGPWSLLFWVKMPYNDEPSPFEPFINVGQGAQGQQPLFRVAITKALPQSVEVTRRLLPSSTETLLTEPCNVTQWSHMALTYDTQRLALYVNGSLASSSPASLTTDLFDTPILSSAPDDLELPGAFLQGVSFWNRAVAPDELEALADSVPVDIEGLQASFPLLNDTFDTVAGISLQLSEAVIDKDQTTTSEVSSVYLALPTGPTTRHASDERTLVAQDYWDLAQSAGITIPSRSERDETQDPDLAAFYQSNYFKVPEPARSRIIDHFDRAYRLGKTLRSRGIKAGQVETVVESGQTVFYYHTLNGRVEIDRRDLNLTPIEVWYITITMDVLFVAFALVGVTVTPSAVGAAVRGGRIAHVFPAIRNALSNASPGVSNAMMIVSNIIGILSNSGLLASFLWNIITYSWWDLLFVGLSVLASIVAIVVAPASVGWRLANAAVALANLGYDLSLKPRTTPAAAAE